MFFGPAQNIIDMLGGTATVAASVSVSETQVRRWTYPHERGGTNGHIPHKHWPDLIELGRTLKVSLKPSDFISFSLPQPANDN